MSQNTQTNLSNTTPYTGFLLAFPAVGTLTIAKTLAPITITPTTVLQNVDVSGSLQLNVSRTLFDINTATDGSGNLVQDSITITSTQLKNALYFSNASPPPSSPSVASKGYMQNVFTNYDSYVNAYFGNTTGFNLPFTYTPTNIYGYQDGFSTQPNTTLTDDQIITLLQDLSGSITVSNLTKLLTFASTQNTFNNRQGLTYQSGFQAGDLIYFQQGITLTLQTNISNNGVLKLASAQNSFAAIDASYSTNFDVNAGVGVNLINYTFSNVSTTNLNLTVNIPLLLRLY